MLELLKAPFLVLHFFYYTLMTFLIMQCVILLFMLIPVSTLSVIKYLICGNNWDWLLNWNLTFEKLWTGSQKALLISMLKKLNLFRLAGLIILVLLMWKLMGPFLRKNHFLRLGLPFSSKLNWYSYIISMAKTTPKKIGDLTCSMRFLSLEVALYLYKPIYSLAWNTVVMSGLLLLAAAWKC